MQPPFAEAREITALVPMPDLLDALGFEANRRTRRCACLLHDGSNPSAFAWREVGRWHCFSCGAGGDKISLVREVRKCSFPEALEFLAALAGVALEKRTVTREEILRSRCERDALRNDARTLAHATHASWNEARDTVLRLEAIRREAGRRLREIGAGKPERFAGESEFCWSALAEVARQMPHAAAAYAIASFANFGDRLRFALEPSTAERMAGAALDCGYVADERGRRFEVSL